jgi:hypothetical protein
MFSVTFPRQLRHVDVALGAHASPHPFSSSERDAITAGGRRATLVHGTASVVVDTANLWRSPYLGTCCLPRWATDHGDEGGDEGGGGGAGAGAGSAAAAAAAAGGGGAAPSLTIAMPYHSPDNFHDDSRVLEMLVRYLTSGALHGGELESVATVDNPSALLELACVAHSALIPDLQLACERRASALLGANLHLLPRALEVAVMIEAGPLMHCCAELVVANLETLIETKRFERLALGALVGVTKYYHASFTRPPRFSLTLSLPPRPKTGGGETSEPRASDHHWRAASPAELWRLPMQAPVALSSSPRSNKSSGSDPGTSGCVNFPPLTTSPFVARFQRRHLMRVV